MTPRPEAEAAGESYSLTPIAYVRSAARNRYEAPRQAAFASTGAFIEFTEDPRLPLAAADLAGFQRIWLIGLFHLNQAGEWHAKVRPPVTPDGGRYGVLSTRSPHRPNGLALSCVTLLEVTPRGLLVGPCDLLEGTPILDIKPYIPEVDAFPESRAGWRDQVSDQPCYAVRFTDEAARQAGPALSEEGLDLRNFAEIQLSRNPFDKRRKRVRPLPETPDTYEIACQLWRLAFRLDEAGNTVTVLSVRRVQDPED